MSSLVSWLFDTDQLTPHGFCLVWRPDLIWSFVLSDSFIAAAYFSIPAVLVTFTRQRKDLVFPWIFLLFGAFILLCGATHVTDVITLWYPAYGLTVAVRVATAVVSVATAVLLWPLMPRALALPSVAQLRTLNGDLQHEVSERRRAEAALRDLNIALEERVAERTRALTKLTEDLRTEILERQRVEEKLRQSAGLLETVVQVSPYAITVRAADHGVMMWNEAAEKMYGFSADEMKSAGYGKLVPQSEKAGYVELLERTRQGEVLRQVPVRRQRADGTMLDINLSTAPVRAADGAILATVVVFEDVTERNAIERQLVQAQKMEAIGNLTGGMAHDFNNLLGIIIGNLDLLRPMLTDQAEADAIARDALDASLRGSDLTRRLLAFARRQALQPRSINLNELVSNTTKLLQRVLDANIRLSMDLAPDLWPVVVDPAQLESSLVNLATNARDAMPDGGALTIETDNRTLDADYCMVHADVAPGDYVMIEISDTGTGMTEAVLSRIFEPFYTTKAPGKGTGLGLSMVFGFMKQSGGHVNIYSEPGAGTTVRLYLPRDASAVAATLAKDEPVPPLPARGETVLVVEDNNGLRRVVMRQIAGLGYRALEAEDAAAALRVLESEKVDLLFTDIVMPGGIDGFKLARLAIEGWPGIKVVLTSGFPGAKIDGNLGRFAPAARLLIKPYRKEDLARILREALDATAAADDELDAD